jgi:hypothetical protein
MNRKKVTIYQENNVPIELIDEDDRSIEDYSKSLTKFLTNTNISILKLSTSSLIIRPSKISAVVAEEMEESVKTIKQKPVKKRVEKIKEVDIITDAD